MPSLVTMAATKGKAHFRTLLWTGVILGVFDTLFKQLQAFLSTQNSLLQTYLEGDDPPVAVVEKYRRYFADCENIDSKEGHMGIINVSSKVSFPMKVHLLSQDVVVSKSILQRGCFDCHLWNKTLWALNKFPGSFLLDIGSNIGLFALSAAAMGKDVYAFEPAKKNWRRTCETLQLNPSFNERLTLFQTALSSKGPTLITYQQRWRRNPSAMQIVSSKTASNSTPAGEQGVDYGWAITLDSLQDMLPTNRPVVIKIDVEGHECEAFAGAMDYLNKVKIRHVIMELTPESVQACSNRKEIFEVFARNGLKPFKWFGEDAYKELDHVNLTQWIEGGIMYNVEWIPVDA